MIRSTLLPLPQIFLEFFSLDRSGEIGSFGEDGRGGGTVWVVDDDVGAEGQDEDSNSLLRESSAMNLRWNETQRVRRGALRSLLVRYCDDSNVVSSLFEAWIANRFLSESEVRLIEKARMPDSAEDGRRTMEGD